MNDDVDEDIDQQLRASFGRMRTRTAGTTLVEPQPEAGEVAPPGEPNVPAKLFIGPNATWYDDRWRWMDWRGKSTSWNPAAAFTFGAWFAYRKMHGWLALYLGWMVVMLSALLAGVPALVPLLMHAVVSVAAGLYGNALYLQHFRRIARRVVGRSDDHDRQRAAIAAAGGVAPSAAYAVPAVLIALTVAISLVLRVIGTGPTINL